MVNITNGMVLLKGCAKVCIETNDRLYNHFKEI
jgi:hypothetical protein